jgi:hypothetical protein
MEFYLGTNNPNWVETENVPLFISYAKLRGRKALPRATINWAMDSAAFSEISKNGRWTISPEEYADDALRYRDEIGLMDWASIQDWMCEPFITDKTGLTVVEHQQRTVSSYIRLLMLAPEVPWVPVLQGWYEGEYLRHVSMYKAEGLDLTAMETVGVGSVCRRQGTSRATSIIRRIADLGIKVHGFGFKTSGLPKVASFMKSADSLAWSFHARMNFIRLPGCLHRVCHHCPRYARKWRREILRRLP